MPSVTEFKSAAEKYHGQKVIIALRGSPDPDSISSALATKYILALWNIDALILCANKISHQENRALVKLLDIDITFPQEVASFEAYQATIYVDSHITDSELLAQLHDKPLLAIIDHHDADLTALPQATYVDIRKDVGATATIMTEYLVELQLLGEEDSDQRKLATALMHGIRSDTSNMIAAQATDYVAMSNLSRCANLALLAQISNQQLTPSTMEIIFLAYQNREILDNFSISFVGTVRTEDRDAIAQAADFMIRRIGIDTVLIFAIVGENIDCSLRTTSDQITPERFIRDSFPEVEVGTYGGRFDKGGFRLPLGIFGKATSSGENLTLLSDLVDHFIKTQFYQKLGIASKKHTA